MNATALLGLIWVILVSGIAMIPYPRHRPYALALLILFPILLVAIIVDYGWLWGALFFGGALSIYRYPAIFLVKRLRTKLGF